MDGDATLSTRCVHVRSLHSSTRGPEGSNTNKSPQALLPVSLQPGVYVAIVIAFA